MVLILTLINLFGIKQFVLELIEGSLMTEISMALIWIMLGWETIYKYRKIIRARYDVMGKEYPSNYKESHKIIIIRRICNTVILGIGIISCIVH